MLIPYICKRIPDSRTYSKIHNIMQRKFFLAGCFLAFFGCHVAFAQTTAEIAPKNAFPAASTELDANEDDWSFFLDEENKLCFIDFETLKVNLSDIIVKNQNGEVVYEDEVFDLPVNTIYEIDFSKLGTGEFDVELRSFTGTMRRSVTIN